MSVLLISHVAFAVCGLQEMDVWSEVGWGLSLANWPDRAPSRHTMWGPDPCFCFVRKWVWSKCCWSQHTNGLGSLGRVFWIVPSKCDLRLDHQPNSKRAPEAVEWFWTYADVNRGTSPFFLKLSWNKGLSAQFTLPASWFPFPLFSPLCSARTHNGYEKQIPSDGSCR